MFKYIVKKKKIFKNRGTERSIENMIKNKRTFFRLLKI